MINRKLFCILGMAVVCLPILSGCGGNKEADSSTPAVSGGQAMLNNPGISEADKEKIRKSMQSSPGGAGGAGTTRSSGTTSGQ